MRLTLLALAYISFLRNCHSVVFPVDSHKLGNLSKHKEMQELITFHLYTTNDQSEELRTNELNTLTSSNFKTKHRTKLIIHDWLDDVTSEWIQEMAEAMAKKNKWNIILVNWSPLSYSFYDQAHQHTFLAAEILANFTTFLCEYGSQPLRSFHYISHGHGLKIVSISAQILKDASKFDRKIYRITVLDPLKETFKNIQNSTPMIKLTRVASFVDVIHTSGSGFGNMTSMGHVDFYPNGGRHQPRCSTWYCSHIKVYEYWTKTIVNPKIYKAYSYRAWDDFLDKKFYKLKPVPMGIAANRRIPSGNYYLET